MNKFKPEIPELTTANWQRIISSTIESSTNAIVISDLNGKLTYVNNSFLKMWGFNDDREVRGRRLLEFWQVKEQALKILGALRERDSWEGELAAKRKDGSTFDVHLSMNIVIDEAGKPIDIIGTFRDITGRKKVEEALHESEEKYRRFLESLADGCFAIDRNWRYVFVNDAACQFVKYTRSELLGNKITKLFPGIEDTPFFQAYKNTMDTGKTNDIEAPFPRPDGTPGYLNIRVSAVPEGIIVIARDITERKKAEEHLRLLSSAVKQCSEGVAVSDLKGNLLFVNNAFAAMHGYAPEELTGKNLSIFHTPEQMPAVEVANRQIQETGEFSGEIWHVRRDGIGFPGLMQNSLLRDEAGNPIGMIGTLRDITELKRAREALRESESQYRLLAENITDVIWTLDMNLRPTYVSSSIEHVVGYTVEEVMSQTLKKMLTPASFGTVMKVFEEELAIEKNEQKDLSRARTLEFEVKCKDGSAVWAEGKMSFLRDQNDQAVGIVGIARDISERKRAEESLRRSEEKWHSVVKNAPNVILIVDRNGTIQFINRTVPGYSIEETVGTKIYDYVPPEYHNLMTENIEKVFQSGEPGKYESGVILPDGSITWYETQVGPVKHDGQIVAVALITTDLTARKRTEEELRESEDRYRLLFNAAPVGIGVAYLGGSVIAANQTMADMTGFTPEELKDVNIRDTYVDPHERERLLGVLQEHGRVRDFEVRLKRKDGTTYFALLNVDIQELAGEKVLFTTSRDITERKKAEAELLQAQKQRLASIGQLAAGVAHEINNPLMALTSEIQLWLEKTKDEELIESFNRMSKFSKRIADTVTDLVTFSREISTNVREASDINSLIKRISSLIEGRLKSKNIEIKKKLGKNLPNLIVDKGQIQQVFMNILMNSLDAMSSGGELTISTKLSRTKNTIDILFVDTGSGIAEENLPKIFDPFFTTKPPGKGVGMGLSVSYRIIENHGGSIKVDSKLNEGTKVLIRLPITESNPNDQTPITKS